MGLDAGFKKFVAATFPRACVPAAVAPEAVVFDVLVGLHMIAPVQDAAAQVSVQRIVNTIAAHAAGPRHVAFCFDHAATTPMAKHVELAKRKRAVKDVTPAAVAAMLEAGTVLDLNSILCSRGTRQLLCDHVAEQLLATADFDHILVLGCGAPRERVAGELRERPDLSLSMHGEADISCIYAAHLMRREVAGRVEIRTVDTDLVAIAMLNSFDGLDVCLTYKQESLYVNVQALCQAMCAAYGLTVHEVVLAIFSRGTDYVEASLTFFRDWNEYLTCLATNLGAAPAGQLQLCAAVRAPVASAAGVDLRRLHAALGATSASKKRSVLKYSANDGHLSRLAWQLLYSARVPLGGGEGLEPERFGWARHEGRTVRVPTQL